MRNYLLETVYLGGFKNEKNFIDVFGIDGFNEFYYCFC